MYPIGAIFETEDDNFNPNNYFEGTWEKIKDKFLFSTGDKYSISGIVGGEYEHILIIDEIPSHSHPISNIVYNSTDHPFKMASGSAVTLSVATYKETTNSTGGGQAHNNMPPFITVNMWKRIS